MVFRCGSLGTSPGIIKEFRRGASADAIALFEINEVLDGSFIYIFIVTCVRVVLVWSGALPVSQSVGMYKDPFDRLAILMLWLLLVKCNIYASIPIRHFDAFSMSKRRTGAV